MRRIVWFKIGGRHLHLLKLAGSFFVFAAVLMVAFSAYKIFVTVDKANYAQARPETVTQLFGWGVGAPYSFSGEDVLGVLLQPTAEFLFWLGVAVVALMVYQSGRVVFPIEEYEQRISEHHRELIRKAVEHARARKAARR